MKISLDWLNQYLDRPAQADEAQAVLTAAGFPVEGVEPVGDDDRLLDVEVTSNRGDCLSHVGVAREFAAAADRTLVPPTIALPDSKGTPADQLTSVACDHPDLCPRYTARVITGVKVAPSPDWLKARLQAIGLRPVNNVVDVTNFVLHELGQPLHAFDLDKLADRRVVVRPAKKDEPFKAIDGTEHKLTEQVLVIADAEKPAAVAGVMGGTDSEVTQTTTDLLLESAVFDPLAVRGASRSLKLASDASYRFERGVDPAGIERASRRAAQLIVQLAGGTLAPGVAALGDVDTEPTQVTMRVARCNKLLGLDLTPQQQADHLAGLGLNPSTDGDTITCAVPSFRLDLRREVDLIEEVARSHGLDAIPQNQSINLTIRPTQPEVRARQQIAGVLTAHGYHEAVTFSFMSEAYAKPFTPEGARPATLPDDRRRAEPMLRPSLVPSLLICRKANQDAGNQNVKLYELGVAWAQRGDKLDETPRLTLLRDAEDDPAGALRELRGTVTELIETLGGTAAAGTLSIDPADRPGHDVAASVRLGDRDLGVLGVLGMNTCKTFGLQGRVAVAELGQPAIVGLYPPHREAKPLPRFPAIERDLSIVLSRDVPWREIDSAVHAAKPELLEHVDFLGAYQGKPIPAGRRSVSFRMLFRDPATTLRHEQVDPQVQAVVDKLKADLGAELRA